VKNIPLFSTDSGVASLILEEIPYKQEAYIKIQSSQVPEKLLNECIDFCKAIGANLVFATGHEFLRQYPVYTELIQMQCKRANILPSDLELKPVEDHMLQCWCDLYNANMRNVPNASTMVVQRLMKLTDEKRCYFVYDDQRLVGIGMIAADKVEGIVSLVSGMGADVMRALCGRLEGEYVTVEVAHNNVPAVKLYKKLGFSKVRTVSTWYCVY